MSLLLRIASAVFTITMLCLPISAQSKDDRSADTSTSRAYDPLYDYRPGHGGPGIVYPKSVTELLRMGEIAGETGELEIAKTAYTRALAGAKEEGDQSRAAYASAKLSHYCYQLEKYGLAANYHEQAIDLFRSMGDNEQLMDELRIGSQVYIKRKRPDLLVRDLTEAVTVAGHLRDRDLTIRARSELSNAYLDQADTTAALEQLVLAYALCDKELNYKSWEATNLELDSLYRSLDSLTQADQLATELIEARKTAVSENQATGESQ